jgi:hypothetical protein
VDPLTEAPGVNRCAGVPLALDDPCEHALGVGASPRNLLIVTHATPSPTRPRARSPDDFLRRQVDCGLFPSFLISAEV